MKKAIVALLAVVGGLVILAVLAGMVVGALVALTKERLPRDIVLEVNLEQALLETIPADPFAELMMKDRPTLHDVVDALDRAAGDDRVKGIVAHLGAAPMGLAQAQELRDAVSRFRDSGRFAVAWSETFGEFGPGNTAYYLATAFDEIWLQPSGDVGLVGFSFSTPFLRGTLEKLGLEPRMDHRYEYKNAMNVLTETEFTPDHREATEAILESVFGQLVSGVAERRGLSETEVVALIDRGPFLGREALEAGLVDHLGYRDEVLDRAEERAGDRAERVRLARYLSQAGRPNQRGQQVALVYGIGAVTRGKSEFDPFSGDATMGSDTVAGAIRAAIDDEDVRAIILRVDSPGGSYVASDTIWRETVRAREAGKPVVVSMGNVAASGGYFVAMAADRIVAQPSTVTGSIGVLGGKLLTDGFWEKLGISWDEVASSRHARLWDGTSDFSESEWERFQAFLDRIYQDFTTKAADGRGMDWEDLHAIAKGRVWTGEDALELGLVDAVGGLETAIRLAKEAAGIPEEETIHLRVFPKRRTLFEMLFDPGGGMSLSEAALQTLERWQPLLRTLRYAVTAGDPQPVRMPQLEMSR